jgi:hypothetical protein
MNEIFQITLQGYSIENLEVEEGKNYERENHVEKSDE